MSDTYADLLLAKYHVQPVKEDPHVAPYKIGDRVTARGGQATVRKTAQCDLYFLEWPEQSDWVKIEEISEGNTSMIATVRNALGYIPSDNDSFTSQELRELQKIAMAAIAALNELEKRIEK